MEKILTFSECFDPYISKFTKITLDKEHESKLAGAISAKYNKREAKNPPMTEIERNSYRKLFLNIAGDVVMEQYLDLDFVDYDKISFGLKEPFINKIITNKKIDIVTFNYGNFPLVYDKTYKKTIFICASPENKRDYYICGLGTPKMIDGYSKKELVQSEYYRNMGKSAFYAFYNLQPIPNFMYDFNELIG